jgi:hypothetical protein
MSFFYLLFGKCYLKYICVFMCVYVCLCVCVVSVIAIDFIRRKHKRIANIIFINNVFVII